MTLLMLAGTVLCWALPVVIGVLYAAAGPGSAAFLAVCFFFAVGMAALMTYNATRWVLMDRDERR